MAADVSIEQAVERVFHEEHGRIVATLIRVFGDFDLAEDALQEAFISAVEHWRVEGVPANAAAWLTTTARRKALDRIRREQTQSKVRTELEREQEDTEGGAMEDAEQPHLLR